MAPDKKFLDKAAQDAARGIKKGEGGPFGAVIVRKGKVLATAHNTVLKTHDPTAHAEMNAIRQAAKKKKTPFFEECVLYSTTEPCPMCFSAIHWGRFKKVIFATSILDVKKLGFNELSVPAKRLKQWGKSPVQIQKIKNPACTALLKKWRTLPNKKTY